MLNTKDFTERLSLLMKNHSLSASAFADAVGVQRSSISHLLSGRNKPSLEFVLKVVDRFPEVHLNWLLFGDEDLNTSPTSSKTTSTSKKEQVGVSPQTPSYKKQIDRIIIFYEDGSFEAFES